MYAGSLLSHSGDFWVESDHHAEPSSHYCIHRRSSRGTFVTLLEVWESVLGCQQWRVRT